MCPPPTEQGMPGINAGVHFMLLRARQDAEGPSSHCCRLELQKIVGDPALKQRFVDIGFEPTPDVVRGDGRGDAQDRRGLGRR